MSDEMKKLIGQAVTDPAFRDELFKNPEQAMKGFNLTKDEEKAIKDAVKDAAKQNRKQKIGAELDAMRGSVWS
ncbi:MAG: Franean1_4349 family RiPP [Oscillochloris sp.]|nr:Franean1_4349 family RiPP [Oscillochloris sp.]